jgi:hypothetical protein
MNNSTLSTITPTEHYLDFEEMQFDKGAVYDASRQHLEFAEIKGVKQITVTRWMVTLYRSMDDCFREKVKEKCRHSQDRFRDAESKRKPDKEYWRAQKDTYSYISSLLDSHGKKPIDDIFREEVKKLYRTTQNIISRNAESSGNRYGYMHGIEDACSFVLRKR